MVQISLRNIDVRRQYRPLNAYTTCRLISLGGKKIEPVGVDYILQKLGFQHARLTIPKWIQRGNMDQLDYVMSVLTKRLLSVLEEDKFYPSRLHE